MATLLNLRANTLPRLVNVRFPLELDMNQAPTPPKKVCIGFEAWHNSPVYKAQCKTFALACDLMDVRLAQGEGLALRWDRAPGLDTFRALKEYRDANAISLRNLVAREIRRARADQRKVTLTCGA